MVQMQFDQEAWVTAFGVAWKAAGVTAFGVAWKAAWATAS